MTALENKKLPSLSEATLYQLPPDVRVPTYGRSALKIGIVQIGPSNFFRGHFASYIEDVIEQLHATDNAAWKNMGICAVSLRPPEVGKRDTRDLLQGQDFLYTLSEQKLFSSQERVIGCLKTILNAVPHAHQLQMTKQQVLENIAAKERVLDRMVHPETQLVTMTVTQDGYGFTRDRQRHICKEPVDYLAEALERRYEQAIQNEVTPKPFTVLSCDNLIHNGTKLRNSLMLCISERPKAFREWVRDAVPIVPATMVDRIVPGTNAEQVKGLAEKHGYHDKGAIFTERFRQFVIQKTPDAKLPPLYLSGAEYVEDVSPYELAKIRILNGAHFALGMVARLHGFEDTSQAMQHMRVASFIKEFMYEVAATVDTKVLSSFDGTNYVDAAYLRLFMPDQAQRLARKSSEKLGPRLLDALADTYRLGLPNKHIIKAVAHWPLYLKEASKRPDFDILDPDAEKQGFVALASRMNGTLDPAFFATGVFGKLVNIPQFQQDVSAAYKKLYADELWIFQELHETDKDSETSSSGGISVSDEATTALVAMKIPQFRME